MPKAVIAGAATGLAPTSIVVDASGNIYAANMALKIADRPNVTVYRANSNGDTAPIATITGKYAVSKNSPVWVGMAVALDSRGRIYIANSVGGFLNNGNVDVYQPLADLVSQSDHPGAKPIATIAGVNTMLARPRAVALDSLGRIYVLSVNDDAQRQIDRITVYPALGDSRGDLDEAPATTIEGSNTELGADPMSIAVLGPKHDVGVGASSR
jgi:hypothetical protein